MVKEIGKFAVWIVILFGLSLMVIVVQADERTYVVSPQGKVRYDLPSTRTVTKSNGTKVTHVVSPQGKIRYDLPSTKTIPSKGK